MYVEVNMDDFGTPAKPISINQIAKGGLVISLVTNSIYTVEDLLKYDVVELLKIDGISLFSLR